MGVPKTQSRYVKPILGTQRSTLPTDVTSIHIDNTATVYGVVAEVCGFASEEKFDTVAYLEAVQKASIPSTEYEGLTMLDMAIINGTVTKSQEYFTKYNPTNVAYYAWDGRVVSGKLNQQRTRRWLAARKRLTPVKEKDDIEDRSAKSRLLFDTNKITPGTRFMEVMDEVFMAKFPTNRHIASSSCVFVYSSYREEGEGEHKIMRLLRSGIVPTTGSHLIISSDSDMVILASLLDISNVYVVRESINTIVNVGMLKFHLGRMYNKNAYRDAVLLLQVLGNDFVPPQPSFLPGPDGQVMPPSTVKEGTPTSLFDEYQAAGRELVTVDEQGRISIDWMGLREVLTALAQTEYTRLTLVKRHATEKDPRWSDVIFAPRVDEDQAYQAFRAAWYGVALGHIDPQDRPEEIRKMCAAYLRTLAWTCVYYFEGNASSSHIYPYRYAPLLGDLVELEWRGGYENEMRVTRSTYMENLPTLPEQNLFVIPQGEDEEGVYAIIQSLAVDYFPLPTTLAVDTLGLAEDEDAEIVAVGGLLPVDTNVIRTVLSEEYLSSISDQIEGSEILQLFQDDVEASAERYEPRPTLVVEIKGAQRAAKPAPIRQRRTIEVKPREPSPERKASPPKEKPAAKAAPAKAPVKAPAKAPVKAPVKAPAKVPAKK